jgi:hypothetical protein
VIGFRYDWDDLGHTVIRMYVGDLWDWDDFQVAMAGAFNLMHTVSHQVDLVTIMRSSTTPPDGDITTHLVGAVDAMPENSGVLVMVGGNAVVNFTLKQIAATYPPMMGRFFQTEALGEAYRIIARNRPEVNEDIDDTLVA